MNLINWINNVTKLNKSTFDTFQNNINDGKIDKSIIEYTGDLDDLKTTGIYMTTSSTTNKPNTGTDFFVEVFKESNESVLQRATNKTSSSSQFITYKRLLYNNTWGDWEIELNINNGIYKHYYGTGIDLNDIKSAGEYGIYGSNTNSPTTSISILKVEVYSPDWIVQTITTVNIPIGQWKRTFTNGTTWSNWLDTSPMVGSSWQPTISCLNETAPTVTYTTRSGNYRIISNKLVYISFYIRGSITALNGTNNYATITGLPITPRGITLGENALSTGVVYNCIQDDTAPVILDISSGNRIQIQNSNGSGVLKWKVTPTNGYFELGGSGFYELP